MNILTYKIISVLMGVGYSFTQKKHNAIPMSQEEYINDEKTKLFGRCFEVCVCSTCSNTAY